MEKNLKWHHVLQKDEYEKSITGGLGSLVSEVILDHGLNIKLKISL